MVRRRQDVEGTSSDGGGVVGVGTGTSDGAQALDGPVRPPGVTVDPALVSPTSSTLPGVISQGLRQTAGPD
ncbi:hypothetical protein GTR02_18230, partial [Kineococcus sp. R8]|uniref:hypothetical protein n=1 Tax=Kineococcus siccus TaxID=2696567 RepID=UPI00141295AB